MNVRRIFSYVLVAAGVGCLLVSNYIQDQVDQGKTQIKSAEKQVQQGNQLFSLNPVTKQIGQAASGGVQKKIAAGKETVAHYEEIAHYFQIGGYSLCILGIGLFAISFLGTNTKSRK